MSGQRRHFALFDASPRAESAEQAAGEKNAAASPFAARFVGADGPKRPFPHPFLDDAAADRLLLKLLAELNREGANGTAVLGPANVVVLAAPHPGAVYYLEDLALQSARSVGADAISLDYLDLLGLVESVSSEELARAGDLPASISAPELRFEIPFRPADYEKLDGARSQSEGMREHQEDSMDEEDDARNWRRDFDEEDEDDQHGYPQEDSSDFEWPGSTGRNRGTDVYGYSRYEEPGTRESPKRNGRQLTDGATVQRNDGGVSITFNASDFSEIKSKVASFIDNEGHEVEEGKGGPLDAACSLIGSKLAAFATSRQSKAPLVVYIRDLNEFYSQKSMDAGPQILESIVGTIDSLRSAGIPALLVAGASPSLAEAHPYGPADGSEEFESQRVATERAEFYRSILAGERLNGHASREQHLRAPYKHILAHRSNPVSTVFVQPPPLPAEPLDSNTISLLPSTDQDSPAAIEDAFVEWERTLALDHARRIAEINLRAMLAECDHRGVAMADHPLAQFISGSAPLPASADEASLVQAFQRHGASWEDIGSAVGRTPESCRSRFVKLAATPEMPLSDDDELLSFLSCLREKLWSPEMVREAVANAIGVRARNAVKRGGRARVDGLPLTLKELIEGVEIERMNEPAYQRKKHADKLAERLRKLEEARLNSSSRGGSRGDGGLAALADTVDNREDSVDPPRLGRNISGHGVPADDGPQSTALKNLLKKRGHQLNTYEKKLLGCVIDPVAIPVGFQDLVLPPTTKLALQTLVTLPLLRPKLFSHGILQKSSFSGVLLFGPPGTGKTFLAKCVAKSGGARFMNIALSDVFDKYVGEGEKNVKAVFTLARKLAPCVVFVDEGELAESLACFLRMLTNLAVDALFGRRRGDTFATRREVMNEWMAEWDGIGGSNSGVIVMAATNRPFDLDDAVLRRMPRRILVDLPNEEARAKIFGVHLKDETLHHSVSLPDLAKRTELYSGSDLRNLCISAALASVKENVVREVKYGLPPLTDPAKEDHETRMQVLREMDLIDEWHSIVPSEGKAAGAPVRLITKEHFDIALKEIPASLTDEMESLAELRKWDLQYGGGNIRKGAKPGWGFNAA